METQRNDIKNVLYSRRLMTMISVTYSVSVGQRVINPGTIAHKQKICLLIGRLLSFNKFTALVRYWFVGGDDLTGALHDIYLQ